MITASGRRFILPLILLGICSSLAVGAEQPSPVVRIEIEPQTVQLGESARMRVTLLVPTWQPRPPVFPSFEVPNAITRLPPDSSRPTTQKIGPDTWSGIIRNYQITPLIAARFELGGQSLRITYADPGSAPITSEITVPAASLLATVPPGAEILNPYLAGEHLELSRELNRDTAGLKVGDALVVHYQAVLEGMPVLFIPPLTPEIDTTLVTVYPAEPESADGERALRRETTTVIVNHGGELILPGLSLDWWKSSTGSIETARIEPLILTIAGPPPPAALAGAERPARSPMLWGIVILLLLAAGLAASRWLPVYLQRRREAEAELQKTEPYIFDRLRRAQGRSSAAVYADTLSWLEKLDPGLNLRVFADRFGDDTLTRDVEAISSNLYGSARSPVDVNRLIQGLTTARGCWLKQASAHEHSHLAALNP